LGEAAAAAKALEEPKKAKEAKEPWKARKALEGQEERGG
jgi:hypothetical protein